MKKILTLAAVAALGLAACTNDESGVSAPREVRILPTIANPSLTPGTRVTDTDFEQGDQVGLTITMTADGSAFASNKQMTFDGTDFKSAGLLWYEDVNATSSLFAYYPYVAGEAAPAEFSVKADQSGENYSASDLIVAVKEEVKPSVAATQMTFKHKMSRIVISVQNESGSAISEILVKGAVGTGVLDPKTGDFTAKSGVAASDVKANAATADKVYYALLVPQNGVRLMVTVTTADGQTRTQTLGTTDLRSGENRTMECVVKPAAIEVKFTGVIDGWVDGEALLPEGGEVDYPFVEWGGVKYRIATLKDGRTWMAENLRYVPQGKSISSDPKDKSGVWYPCNLNKVADPSLAESKGLLYSYPVLLGLNEELNDKNYNMHEGAQGICPDGWHIPTKAEWLKLAGAGSGNLSDSTSPYFDSVQGGAPIEALNADGMNIFTCGYINAATSAAVPAYLATASKADPSAFGMGYYAGSTAHQVLYNTTGDPASGVKNVQFFAGMLTYNTTFNRLTVAYLNGFGAVPVRCIKDAQ